MKNVLVTGAGGFVGGHLCAHLARCGWNVTAVVRTAHANQELAQHAAIKTIADITSETEWNRLLPGVSAVVHLAARVHIMHSEAPGASAEYQRVNTVATSVLARAAARLGVGNFVFLSTIKVNGERTSSKPFSEADTLAPLDPYAQSKWEAERALNGISTATSMAVSTLRPPLVYGPGVKGNFLRLMNLVHGRMPLPLASVNNSRSLLYVGNLVSAIERCLTTPNKGAETFLVSDGHDLSTPQLIAMLAAALKVTPRLFRCPVPMLLALGKIAGKGGEMTRMVESLSVDCSKIQRQLQWSPPFTVEQGLDATARWFLDVHSSK